MEFGKDKKLIITPLDESTKQISQVLANDTCRAILNLLSSEPLSSSQISEKLNLPLTTVEYNIDRLSEVGLITVDHKRWSLKGKKINFYAPAEKYILIAPKTTNAKIFETLKKMLPALTIVALVSGVVELITRILFQFKTSFGAKTIAALQAGEATAGASVQNQTPAAIIVTVKKAPTLLNFLKDHPGAIIFIIGMLIILLYVIYKNYRA